MSRPRIIAKCSWGLGNRLKCLLSAMRAADEASAELWLYWPATPNECNCKFSDLFENKFHEISSEKLAEIEGGGENKAYRIINTWRLEVMPEDDVSHGFSRVFPSALGLSIDHEYERIPLKLRERFLKYVHILKPVKDILCAAEEYDKYFKGGAEAIHIRSWLGTQDRAKLFDRNAVYELLKNAKEKKYFICCDSETIFKEISIKYGDRVFFHHKRTYFGDNNSKEGVQDALTDMLIAAKASHLKASYLSTFPEMIWWLGGCKARVEILPIKKHIFCRVTLSAQSQIFAFCIFGNWHIRRIPMWFSKFGRLLERRSLKVKRVPGF